jgi:hypothetical protein
VARTASSNAPIRELSELVQVWQDHHDSTVTAGTNTLKHIFVEHLPSVDRAKLDTALLTSKYLPCPVKNSHCFRFTINDRRRLLPTASLKNTYNVVTGVTAVATVLPSLRGAAERTSFVKLAVLPAEVAEVLDAEAADGAEVADGVQPKLDELSNSHLGWRCSYRKDRPEDLPTQEPKVLRRLAHKTKIIQPIVALLEPASRHRPVGVKVNATSSKGMREKQHSKFMRDQRSA